MCIIILGYMWRIESYLLVLRLSEVVGCIWSIWSACDEEMFRLQDRIIGTRRSCLTRLFWHLPCLKNAHLPQVNSAFTACEQLQNSSCYTTSNSSELSNKALLASALSGKCSFTLSKLRFFSLRAASK